MMRIRTAVLCAAIAIALGAGGSPALAQTIVSVGAGGIFPAGTTFSGVPINGLQSGYGIEIVPGGPAIGQFCTVLVGISLTGAEQTIVIQGKATGGSQTAANVATFSGTCTINMGDGSLPVSGVPFTATITTDANDQGTIGLLLGQTTLPNATVDLGSMTIR